MLEPFPKKIFIFRVIQSDELKLGSYISMVEKRALLAHASGFFRWRVHASGFITEEKRGEKLKNKKGAAEI